MTSVLRINMLERMRETSSTIYNAVNGVSYGSRLFYVVPFYAGFFMNEKKTSLVHKNININFIYFAVSVSLFKFVKRCNSWIKTAEHTLSGNGMEHTQGELFGFGWIVLYHYYYDYIYGCISLKYFRVSIERSM